MQNWPKGKKQTFALNSGVGVVVAGRMGITDERLWNGTTAFPCE